MKERSWRGETYKCWPHIYCIWK